MLTFAQVEKRESFKENQREIGKTMEKHMVKNEKKLDNGRR